MKSQKTGINTILTALFAALISASCFIQIPLPGGIPIVIQDMMCLLSGLLLGPIYGTISIVIFLILGSLGLPVFSGKGGIQHLISGPTCGFLWGYIIAVFVAGLIPTIFLSDKKEHSKIKSLIVISIASISSTVIFFVCGIIGFMHVTQSGLGKALATVLIPFVPGNIIKIILMTVLAYKFRPVIFRYTHT